MKIVVQLPKDINKFCRTCMCITDSSNSFEDHVIKDLKLTELGGKLESVTATKVDVNECLPASMCSDCVEELNRSYVFKNQCVTTENNIRTLLSLANPTKSANETEELNLKNVSEPEKQTSISSEHLLQTDESNVCHICQENFHNYYVLSRHMMQHNIKKNLLERFLDNRQVDLSDYHKDPPQIDGDVEKLVKERKFPSIELPPSPQIPKKPQSIVRRKVGINQGPILLRRNRHVACKLCFKRFKNRTELVAHTCVPLGDVSKDSKPFICTLCNRHFSDNSSLSLHFINHALASDNMIKSDVKSECLFCEICGQTFKFSFLLDDHYIDAHTNKPEWECALCSSKYEREVDLIRHETEHVETQLPDICDNDFYACPLCSAKFYRKAFLINHSIDHLMKNYTCHKCKKTYYTQHSYFEHLKLHPEYDHVCPVCDKHLVTKSALKNHIVGVHSKELHHECLVCGKRFSTEARLKTHSKIHSSHKKYVCTYCGYATHKPGDLKTHTRTHTSERPYKCTFANCTKTFKTSSHLCNHIRRHLQVRRFKCSVCSTRFGTTHGLKIHQMQHTGEKPFTCLVCNTKFRRKYHLKVHMKTHSQSTD